MRPIVVQGSQLINSKTKDRLQIIGVEYVQLDSEQCVRVLANYPPIPATSLVDLLALSQDLERIPSVMARCVCEMLLSCSDWVYVFRLGESSAAMK